MIKPRADVDCADRLEAKEIADGALQPLCRRMARADAWELSVRAVQADQGDLAWLLEQRHMHRGRLAPKPEQRELAPREQVDRLEPALLADLGAWPRPVRRRDREMWDAVEQRHAHHPNRRATFWKPETSAEGR